MKVNGMELRPLAVSSLLVLMALITTLAACLGDDREADSSQTSAELREVIREVLREQREDVQTATPSTPEASATPFTNPIVDTRPTRPPEQSLLADPPFAHEPSPTSTPTPEPTPELTFPDDSVAMPDLTPVPSLTPTPLPTLPSDQPEPDPTARVISRSVSDIVADSAREVTRATITFEFSGFSAQSYSLAIVSGRIIEHCGSIDDSVLPLRELLWTEQYELQVFTESNCLGIPVQSPQFLFVPQDIESTG